jgi:MFS family permease
MPEKGFRKNFRLLLIGAFFAAFIFYYSVEKLFLLSIGFSNFEIGIIIALTAASVLVFEFPSGVLADRWSRKGTVILGLIALIVSNILGYYTNGVFVYALAMICWGMYYAMQSGVYSSLVYDMLLENKMPESEYDRFYGKTRVVEGLALVVSALTGSALANYFGFRTTYALSIPAGLVAIFIFLKFQEPRLHKTESNQLSTWAYIGDIRHYLKSSKFLILAMLQLVIIYSIFTLGFEFSQLYYVAIGLPVVIFGFAYAATYSSFAFGGILANILKHQSNRVIISVLVMGVFASGLQFLVRGSFGLLLPAILLTIFMALEIRFGRILHGQLPSKYRASATSLANTFARIFVVPASLLFGWLVGATSYYWASLITTSIVFVALIVGVKILKHPSSRSQSKIPIKLEPSPKP